uniref:Uncharacterized protein n=1 Tax=Anser brachyrhynchus TaxID=132585 RepID=A0A8B9C4W3_9AVES
MRDTQQISGRPIFAGCRCGLQNQEEHLALLKAGVCICREQEFCLVRRCSLLYKA